MLVAERFPNRDCDIRLFASSHVELFLYVTAREIWPAIIYDE